MTRVWAPLVLRLRHNGFTNGSPPKNILTDADSETRTFRLQRHKAGGSSSRLSVSSYIPKLERLLTSDIGRFLNQNRALSHWTKGQYNDGPDEKDQTTPILRVLGLVASTGFGLIRG
jgi:hypothetical protein